MIEIQKLYKEQLQAWPQAKTNYEQLQSVTYREFDFHGFTVKAQFNPERIRSAGAKVDEKSLQQRPCFLCPDNRPSVQTAIDYPPHYSILINPYPIFPEHLTIPDKRHLPQSIEGRITDMLQLAKELSEYTLMYNGPRSGASAPDHFHFQAAMRNAMPFEQDVHAYKNKIRIQTTDYGSIYYMKDYLRRVFLFESTDSNWLLDKFYQFSSILQSPHYNSIPFDLNILLWFEDKTGYLAAFPRGQHRPSHFFATGTAQLLVSPGIVDMAGLLILVRKEDFDKLDNKLIVDIYSQVSISIEEEQEIISRIKIKQD
jgi:hypothetical protein